MPPCPFERAGWSAADQPTPKRTYCGSTQRRSPPPSIDTDRRPGGVAGSYTKSDRAAELPGRAPKLSLADGIRSALDWLPVRDELLKG
ncbi:hypothetical protein [Streptomyces sp. NPDC101165]|uniref:hypothetical protein n=1 Tax=Streptomyces sp. NPDC101165 TaxID=3366119 RepID=UPI003825710D